MTPHEVAADSSRRLRFQTEVAYLDRMQPPEVEVDSDTKRLGSEYGVLIVAWLWPTPSYEPGFDPFDAVSAENQVLWENAAKHLQPVGTEKAFETVSLAFDRQRRERLWVAARRFTQILEATARAVDRSVEDLKTHLQWSVPLTQLELARLLYGHTPFPFLVIVKLCHELQLEFTDAWILVEPQLLARRIDESVLASGISDDLRCLTLHSLESVRRKLPPRRNVNAGRAQELGIYRAPGPDGRYGSLYEALAADVRDYPAYTIAEIDRLLLDAGEMRLPDSASTDPFWWAGNGAKTKGRPQLSAWWAAGYRIRKVEKDPSTGQVTSIGFAALPGRADWLTNPERTAQRKYQVPGRIEIYRDEDDLMVARIRENPEGLKGMMDALAKLPAIFAAAFEKSPLSKNPDDPDVRHLVEFLDKVREADRSQIEGHFNLGRDKPVDAAWMTNLLTKARRQGWTVNNGTRSRPRWASTRLTAALIEGIADNWNLETPAIDTRGAVPVEFLQLLAKTVGVDSAGSTGPEIARRILESKGRTWQPEFESADKSVTGLGLKAVNDAIGIPMPPEAEIVCP
jgi:hypothetical protein